MKAEIQRCFRASILRCYVTNLEGGRAKHVYERLYCAHGQAENHIKAWKNPTRAAILTRRRRKVSNCITRQVDRLGMTPRIDHKSQ